MKDITLYPANYPACSLSDCPMASHCLRQLAYGAMLERETYIRLINPTMCEKSDNCTFYRSSQPQQYARGFTGFQEHMFSEQYKKFMDILTTQFGRNPYFARRRGTIAISPKEQEIILAALHEAGIAHDIPFDAYEEAIDWHD